MQTAHSVQLRSLILRSPGAMFLFTRAHGGQLIGLDHMALNGYRGQHAGK